MQMHKLICKHGEKKTRVLRIVYVIKTRVKVLSQLVDVEGF